MKLFSVFALIGFIICSNSIFAADSTYSRKNTLAAWQVTVPAKIPVNQLYELPVQLENKSAEEWTGYLVFELQDDSSHKVVDGLFSNVFPNQYFTLEKNGRAEIKFPFTVPASFHNNVHFVIKMYKKECIDTLIGRIKL
ncbi:hypothetical protein QTN47_26945 [Danxiaibacter flavus]|uniref:Uncharacterized protein n=1 Tax=Danxiaibacter flavus TaxID=3049108 RepID=A0ABV3ZMR4_9BACT|nr:hypothetical protein QNM32_26945 [Chitinophagaceae bacterium DXS]